MSMPMQTSSREVRQDLFFDVVDKRLAVSSPEDEYSKLLREVRDYLKLNVTKSYYLNFPPSMVRISEASAFYNYSALGDYFVQDYIITDFAISVDFNFIAALQDVAGIQGGVPIQCEPYELIGYVNFFISVNGVSADVSSYQYHDAGGVLRTASGWGVISKTYKSANTELEPFYVKNGDVCSVGYTQLQAPLRQIAKIGYFERMLIVDKVFLQRLGILGT